jgi:hypothetical protein
MDKRRSTKQLINYLMKNIKSLLVISCFIFLQINIQCQDIDNLLEQATNSETIYTSATFKSSHIVCGQSIEQMKNHHLDFRISHQLGLINGGLYNFFGLDGPAKIHLSLDYGITDWMMVGIGRGDYEKTVDGLLKFRILRQSSGSRVMPISLSLFNSIAMRTEKWTGNGTLPFWDRASYVTQLLVARKFGERFSFEMNPTYVHRNFVDQEIISNDLWSLGFGARYKLSKRFSINAEYYYVYPHQQLYGDLKTYDPISIGVDIETGGHVFQIHLSNSTAMIEKAFLGETTNNWLNGGIHLGFSISRVFSLKK